MTTKPLVSQDEIDFDTFGPELAPTSQAENLSGEAIAEPQATQEAAPPPASVESEAPIEPKKAGEPEQRGRGAGEPSQLILLDIPEWWREHWRGLPEFVQNDCMPWKTLYVHFENRADMEAFSKLVGQQIGVNTRFIWFPEAEIEKVAHMRWVDAPPLDADEDDEIIETVEGE